MNKEFLLQLEKLKKLNLPFGQYAIFGSGILVAKDIRNASDVDIIAKQALFNKLWEKYSECIVNKPFRCLIINGIEIVDNRWDNDNNQESTDKMIDNAEIIDGLPYVNLQDTILWKTQQNRGKDLRDIELINNYLKNKSKPNYE